MKAHTSKATSNATEPEAKPKTPDEALKVIRKAIQQAGFVVEEVIPLGDGDEPSEPPGIEEFIRMCCQGIIGSVMSMPTMKMKNFLYCRMVFQFAAMPEDQWEEFKGAGGQPCGEEGCECHLRGQKLMDLLQEVRDAM